MTTAAMVAPVLIGPSDLARMIDCSRRHVEHLDTRGHLPKSVRLGRLRKWRLDEITAWIAAGAPPRDEWEAASAAG
jgi:predicted DNA-binding transcriptional regulator AlpA